LAVLPSALTVIEVPALFSPTALVTAGTCRLKATLGSTKVERLGSGPEAAVGTLIHRILERTWNKEDIDVDAVFDAEYGLIVAELLRDPKRAHFADLSGTRSLAEWSSLRAWVRTRSLRGGSRTHDVRVERARESGLGAERLLQSQALRLRGRADRVRRVPLNTLEVRDFKSGATLDHEGHIKPEIALQLMAYGLMVLEQNPNVTVRLVVDDGEERELAFDLATRERAREVLLEVANGLPPPGVVSAETLASPGPSCWNCPFRHTCSSYLTIAPTWWKTYPKDTERVPFDIWGTLSDVSQCQNRSSVRLIDAAARLVRVDGIDPRHDSSLTRLGSTVFFFGLEATGPSRDFDGGRFHPRSFHELPRDRSERRAWTTSVFSIEPE